MWAASSWSSLLLCLENETLLLQNEIGLDEVGADESGVGVLLVVESRGVIHCGEDALDQPESAHRVHPLRPSELSLRLSLVVVLMGVGSGGWGDRGSAGGLGGCVSYHLWSGG
jgi:hypothetical protein